MAVLKNKIENTVLFEKLFVANTLWARGVGLLGRRSMPSDEAILIIRCNSIHTFFMKFPIDCVFLDKNMKVKSIRTNIGPGRIVFPVWGASSVIELAAGVSNQRNIKVGDQLDVGD
jgi:hypothetical protein